MLFNRKLEASQGGGFRNNESLPRVPQGGTRQSGRGQKNGIRISFIGSREGIPADIRLLMKQVERIGRKEDRIMLNIAVNYGGRQEIAESVREIAEDVKKAK